MIRADLLRMIAREELFCDLEAEHVWDGSARVFLDESAALLAPPPNVPFATLGVRPPVPLTLTTGRRVRWTGIDWVIEVATRDGLWLRDLSQPAQELLWLPIAQAERLARAGTLCGVEEDLLADLQAAALARWNQASPRYREVASSRYKAIEAVLAGDKLPARRRRTIQRWRDDFRRAQREKGNGLLGLMPSWSHRGRPLSDVVAGLIEEVVREHYLTPVGKSQKVVYGVIARRAAEAELPVPNRRTVARHIARRRTVDVARAREGTAVAYQSEAPVWHLEPDAPVHGGWPFHIAHADHTELDIKLVSSKTGEVLGKPWLSVLQDAFSRRILAMWLTFDPPSYRSDMMLLRLCVANHNRLPQVLVVDNGSDFGSAYFEQALAWYGVEKRERPPRQPRYGAPVERILGIATKDFIGSLPGNTKVTKNIRQMTPEVDPDRYAMLDLVTLHEALVGYFRDVYEQQIHRALRATPADAFERGLRQTAARPTAHIPYTLDFVVSMLPTTSKGSAMVHANHGVAVMYLQYWSPAFAGPGIPGTQVPVRYDPADLQSVWAYVAGRWERCGAFSIPGGWPRTERELMVVASEIRAEFKQLGKRFRASAESLSEHLDRADVAAKSAAQRRRDEEATILLDGLGLSVRRTRANGDGDADEGWGDDSGGPDTEPPTEPVDTDGGHHDELASEWVAPPGLTDDWRPY